MFTTVFEQYDWDSVRQAIYACTTQDVLRALSRERRSMEDLMALLSPAAAPYLEQLAQLSHSSTVRRFGKTIQMYAPLYLSNECQNICTYCAFSMDNAIRRKTLNDTELLQEATALKAMGYDHILLVTGEATRNVGIDYLASAVRLLRPLFSGIAAEVQPLDQPDYERLIGEGLDTVLVYQETYHQARYRHHHPKGKKSNFRYRLETPDRLGKAGIRRIGLGTLIGLEDWRTDCFFTALHLRYLSHSYWQTRYTISFPRLRPIAVADEVHQGRRAFEHFMNDRELVQLICAYRLFDEELELSLSTREAPEFRDHIIPLGITSISAGSKTNPGGYSVDRQSLEQFEISDERSPAEIAAMIRGKGYEPVWKDWDPVLMK